MPDAMPLRRPPLADVTPLAGAAISLAPLPPAARVILRARSEAMDDIAASLGIALPVAACRAATAGARAALWLGPDEWLLLAPEADGAALLAALAGFAAVDVSHRQAGLTLEGGQAAAVLNAGCPLDLDLAAFPVGMCTRSVLGKTEIVLWRTGPERFRVEAGRSFLPYVWQFLTEAARAFLG